jgi:hypothetical protein
VRISNDLLHRIGGRKWVKKREPVQQIFVQIFTAYYNLPTESGLRFSFEYLNKAIDPEPLLKAISKKDISYS